MHNLSCACSIKVELFSDPILYSNIGGKLLEFIYTYLIRVCVEKKKSCLKKPLWSKDLFDIVY